MNRTIRTALVCACMISATAATTWHLDATAGNDTTGDGSEAHPWQTINFVKNTMAGGDTVLLHAGTYEGYEDLNESGPDQDGWIVFMPYGTDSVVIDTCRTGHWNDETMYKKYIWFRDVTFTGMFISLNVHYLRFTNVTALDGFDIGNSYNAVIESSRVERIGPWTGSEAAIGKFAVGMNGGNLTIRDCEITNTAGGIGCRGDSIRVLRNHIHHIAHDGIRVMGGSHSLVEGNLIHNLDDGVDDGDADWSKHCDAIHIFIRGGDCSLMPINDDLTVRGNIIYDIESQGVQVNNYIGCPLLKNGKIVFENNIFAPTRANIINISDAADTVIFRNNTFVYLPEGRTFTSDYRTLTCSNHTLRIKTEESRVFVYNNLLADAVDGSQMACYDWNVFRSNTQSRALGRFSLVDTAEQLADPESFTGGLAAASPAVDAGTRLFAPDPVWEYDVHGTARDNRPDIGAYEVPGRDPVAETPLNDDTTIKTIFVDDLADGNLKADPWLDSTGVTGLSWAQESTDSGDYTINRNDVLEASAIQAPLVNGVSWLYAEQGGDWSGYTLRYRADNAYIAAGDGPLVLLQDRDNCYWIETGSDTGRVWRIMDGVATLVDTSNAIRMSRTGARSYRISVSAGSSAVVIGIDRDANGTDDLTVTDTDPTAVARFAAGGGIGLHRQYPNQYNRLSYTGFRVEVSRFATSGIARHMPRLRITNGLVEGSNPCRIGAILRFTDAAAPVTVYDRTGNAVVTGIVRCWNGTDASGAYVVPGIYFVESDGYIQQLMMVK